MIHSLHSFYAQSACVPWYERKFVGIVGGEVARECDVSLDWYPYMNGYGWENVLACLVIVQAPINESVNNHCAN